MSIEHETKESLDKLSVVVNDLRRDRDLLFQALKYMLDTYPASPGDLFARAKVLNIFAASHDRFGGRRMENATVI